MQRAKCAQTERNRRSGGPADKDVIELMRTNDMVLISAIEALLNAADINHFVADGHMSVLEGSIGFLPRRILVPRDEAERARRLLTEAGYGGELKHG